MEGVLCTANTHVKPTSLSLSSPRIRICLLTFNRCAKSAVYYQAQYSLTYSNCPNNPLALASCACAKDANSASVSTAIISDVRESCSTTASEDVTSALAVFGLYCSAANGAVTPKGITASGRYLNIENRTVC